MKNTTAKKVLLIVGALALLAVSSFFLVSGEGDQLTAKTARTTKDVEKSFNLGWTSCEDSDAGINKKEKGTVIAVFDLGIKKFTREYTDEIKGHHIQEFYCDGLKPRKTNINCEGVALDGICQPTLQFKFASQPNILIAGDSNVEIAKFELTAQDDDIKLSSLKILNRGEDQNINSLWLTQKDKQSITGSLSDNIVELTNLDLILPENQKIILSLIADLNEIDQGAISGGKIIMAPSEIEMTSEYSGKLVTNTEYIGKSEGIEMTIYKTKPTLSLSENSPIGNHSRAKQDDVFIFNISADEKGKVIVNKIKIDLESDESFNTDTEEESVGYLKIDGEIIAEDIVEIKDDSNGSVTFIPGGQLFEIAEGSSKTFTLELDTKYLIDRKGRDNLLTPSILLGDFHHKGRFLWGDTNINYINWVGDLNEKRLNGETLEY